MAWFYKLQEHMDTILDYKNNMITQRCINRMC